MIDFEERLTCLRGIGILAATPEPVLVEVAGALCELRVKAGQTIFTKGEMGDSLYIIADGKVGIYDGQLLLGTHDQGNVFGEMAVLDAQSRSATATAASDCRLYRLGHEEFRRLLSERGEVAEGVITVLCQRLRGTNSQRYEDYEYLRLVALITSAAHDLEVGAFHPESLAEVTQRTDSLGHLARVFQKMGREVQAREEALKQQVRDLLIEIDPALQAKQVEEITDTDFFKNLQHRALSTRRARTLGKAETTVADASLIDGSGA